MKFSKSDVGTYAAVRFTEDTLDIIEDIQKVLNIFDPVPRNKIHSTICFSRVFVPFRPIEKEMDVGTTGKLTVFEHNGKRALVLLLDSPYLQERHEYAMALGATFDFPTYSPHITLSYDIGATEIPPVSVSGNPLRSSTEYVEDLDLDWKPK